MAEELDAGTAEPLQTDDPFAGTPLEGYAPDDGGQTEGTEFDDVEGATGEEGATSDDEALIPFDQLPQELRPHVAHLTKIHQQKMAEVREQQQKIDAYDRFMTDAEYQRQFLQNAARQLGWELRPGGGQQPPQAQQPTNRQSVSNEALQIAQEALADDPDMQFLAPTVAKIADAIASKRLEPFKQQQVQSQKQQQEAEFDRMAQELSERAPGWEEHESEMADLWQFIERAAKGGPRFHPRFGNVLTMMHKLVAGDAQAVAQAGRRMRQALNSRDTTSSGRQPRRPDVRNLIDEAKDTDTKWDIAFRDAVGRHARR